jgi:CTP-dependent riboflavin kinase
MKPLKGRVVTGVKHFTKRMSDHPEPFRKATGETLYRGTLNVKIDRCIPVKEHFRIRGAEIGEPQQDLIFEICRINGTWSYRIRPYVLCTGAGGHGDDTIEIASSKEIHDPSTGRKLECGDEVEIELFRDDL